MYDDVDYRFNWVGLIIKIVIFIVLILIAVAVISMTIDKNKKGNSFDENADIFKEAALNYFVGDKLPKQKNGKIVLTLKEMIDKNIISELKDKEGNSCDVDKSYVEVTNLEDHYLLSTNLYCGEDHKIDKTTINMDTNEKEDTSSNDEKENQQTTENNDNTSSNTNSNNSTNSGKKTYYEYVKVNKKYTPWQLKKISGNNVESKTDTLSVSSFCKVKDVKFYSTGYVNQYTQNYYTYKVKLLSVPNNASNVKILGKGYFNNDLSYYRAYLDNANLSIVGGDSKYGVAIPDIYTYRDSSLKSSNFTFTVSSPKKEKDGYYVEISVSVKNRNNVTPYYASNLKEYIYYVPLYFYGQYTDMNSCVKDTNENATAYTSYKIYNTHKEKVTVYRSYTLEKDYNDTKWSTQSSLDGYVKTGKTELR